MAGIAGFEAGLHGAAGYARVKPGKFEVQRDVVQGFFRVPIGMPEELLQQLNAQHDLGGKGWPVCLAGWHMRGEQGEQLGPRNHPVHLVEKFPLALRRTLESGLGKADLFHLCSMHHGLSGMIFVDLP